MIGIIGAMDIEINSLKNIMTNKTYLNISNVEYVSGKLYGCECVLAVCGIGKVAAGICAQTMILKYNVSKIINIGVAGSACKDVKVLDIVLSDFVVQHDMDTSAIGDKKGMISGINIIKIPADVKLIDICSKICNDAENINYHVGTIASGDKFISSKSEALEIHNEFDAIAVEMEGAAIGQVCYLNSIPFLVIRAMSDNADSNSDISYEEFLPIAKEKTHIIIQKLLPYLKK